MACIKRSHQDAFHFDGLTDLDCAQQFLLRPERSSQHPRRQLRAIDGAEVKGAVEAACVIGVRMREEVVTHVWLDEVEAVDDEFVERRLEALQRGMLCRHSVVAAAIAPVRCKTQTPNF